MMPKFFNPKGRSTYGIGVCARCYKLHSIEDLFDDPNYPGLKVCRKDMDVYDPYKLPSREPDPITLIFVRPDVPVVASTTPPDQPGDDGWPFQDSDGIPGM